MASTSILDTLVLRLPVGVQPYAKALVPVVVAGIAVLGQVVANGEVDLSALLTAVGGAVTALLVLATRNVA